MEEKTKGEILKEKLFFKPENAYKTMSEQDIKEAFEYCEGFKKFLDASKTEREAVNFAAGEAKKQGFIPFEYGKKYNAGDKVYFINRQRAVILTVIGKEPLSNGLNIAAAHIDSPRLDLKPRPVYEDYELAFFKTHYYGGIKKYQWTALPLTIHGIIIKKDGSSVSITVGEEDSEPVFCVTDLLPHLAKEQLDKPLKDAISGESLNVLIGSIPFKDDKASEKVKLNILNILFEKYGITEADFLSAELEVVPAIKARDVGFDKSLIGAYGQDDRVCAYPALTALLAVNSPQKTCMAVLTDKEEIGSTGNTGLKSDYLKNFIKSLCDSAGENSIKALNSSKCLSADVNAGFDPNYPDVSDKLNACYINCGAVLTKYTGSKGKSSTSDASAELMGYFINLFNQNGIIWQTGELGKVDQGGGGTVAQYLALADMDVVDLGVPVLSMHSPFEITSKSDIYMTYKAIRAFFA